MLSAKIVHKLATTIKINAPMAKSSRKQDIKKLISSLKITNQDELLEELRQLGYELTQATLSRDLKSLGVAKMPDNEKGYIYVLPEKMGMHDRMPSSLNLPTESVISLEFSYNFGIVRTLPGFASSVAIYIDSFRSKEIAGTIAGDDTILIIPREPASNEEVKKTLQHVLPKLFEE